MHTTCFVLCDHVSSAILRFEQQSFAKVRMGQKEKVEKMEKAHTDKALSWRPEVLFILFPRP